MNLINIIEYLTGGISADKFTAAAIFAGIGVFLSLMIGTTERNVLSDRTPVQFSWRFFWSDNTKKFVVSVATGLIVIFISLRFAKELFGIELSMFYSFGVGLGIDKLIEYFKKIKREKESKN